MSVRREIVFVASLACLTAAACGNLLEKLKDKADAGEDAGVEDAAMVTGSGIENEAAITRYEGAETVLETEAKLTKAAVVHSSWPGTDIVATLTSDTAVLQLASHEDGVLVVFEQAGSKKMGWIDAKALPPLPVVDATVPAAEEPDDDDKPSTNNNSNATKKDAGGSATATDAGASTSKDAGASTTKDAGASTAKDAGTTTLKDAGTTPSKTFLLSKPAKDGKCDSGWVELPKGEGTCRKSCNADSDCGPYKCRPKGSAKVCSVGT